MIHVMHVPKRPHRGAHRWFARLGWVVLAMAVLVALMLAWLGSTLWAWQGAPVLELPFPVRVNGHDLGSAIDRGLDWLQALDTPARMGLVFGAALVGLLLVVLLPALLMAFTAFAVALSLALAVGVLALVLLCVGLALTPLLLPLALLWWLAKPRAGQGAGRPSQAASAHPAG